MPDLPIFVTLCNYGKIQMIDHNFLQPNVRANSEIPSLSLVC